MLLNCSCRQPRRWPDKVEPSLKQVTKLQAYPSISELKESQIKRSESLFRANSLESRCIFVGAFIVVDVDVAVVATDGAVTTVAGAAAL